jgi:hypothetical protein
VAVNGMARSLSSGGCFRAPLFLAIWVIMMVAMMFPAAVPMILTFHKVQTGKRERGDAFVSTWMFVAAYILVWALAGVAAYAGALAAETIAVRAAISSTTAARIGGAVIILAGIYQLTPLKDRCLSNCRTPITFIMTSWRDGAVGAMRMGLLHGAYCLGCCWLLFVILFPLGIMNIAAMANHAHRIRRENAALGRPGTSCHGSRARGVWWGGDRGTPSPSDLPERWRGSARRNANENARKRERTCHEVTDSTLDVGSVAPGAADGRHGHDPEHRPQRLITDPTCRPGCAACNL